MSATLNSRLYSRPWVASGCRLDWHASDVEQPQRPTLVPASPLVAYEGCAASQRVVQRTPFGVEFLRHPVDRRRLHAIRFRIYGVYQGATDSASPCCRSDEQVFEVTDVLQRPGGRMKHVMDESDQAAVASGDQSVGLHTLIHQSRKGPVRHFDRNMLPIKAQIARPQCIPLHTVTRSHGSDLGHRTCLLIRGVTCSPGSAERHAIIHEEAAHRYVDLAGSDIANCVVGDRRDAPRRSGRPEQDRARQGWRACSCPQRERRKFSRSCCAASPRCSKFSMTLFASDGANCSVPP